MDWSKMSETCFFNLSGGLRTYRESPLTKGFKGVIQEELRKKGEDRDVTLEDCYAAADYVFSTGIRWSLQDVRIRAVSVEIKEEEMTPYRGIVRHFFDCARLESEESAAFAAAILCAAFLTDSKVGPRSFPLSWEWLIAAQKAVGAFFGLTLPGDSLLPEARRLLFIARQALFMPRGDGLLYIFKALREKEAPLPEPYFTASLGKYKVVGRLMDDDFAFQGEYSSLEEAVESVGVEDNRLLGKYAYDDQGLLIW
jgi:hypothetical protein